MVKHITPHFYLVLLLKGFFEKNPFNLVNISKTGEPNLKTDQAFCSSCVREKLFEKRIYSFLSYETFFYFKKSTGFYKTFKIPVISS